MKKMNKKADQRTIWRYYSYCRKGKIETNKKLLKLEQALEDGKDYHKYQEYGDLIFAYMYQIQKKKQLYYLLLKPMKM